MNYDQITLVATATGCVPAQREIYTESDWTSTRATKVDNLDVAVSSRSTFSGGTVSSVLNPVTVGQNNDKNGYGLSSLYSRVLQNATAQSGTTATLVLNGGSSVDNIYVGNLIMIIGGTGTGQTRVITGYTAATQTVSVDRPFAQAPDSTSQYAILAADSPRVTPSLEVAVGGYAAGMDPATQIGGLGYTSVRAANLDNIDAKISTRSTYAGGDTPGTSTLVGRLTSQRAANLDFIDASITSRMSSASFVAPPSTQDIASSILTNPSNKLSTDSLGHVCLNLMQAVPLSNPTQTLGDALNAARAQGFGAWKFDPTAKTLCLFAPDGVTVVRQFTLDSSTAPTMRN